MPKIYCAFRTDTDDVTKMASGSMTTLKEKMRGVGPGAEFTVVHYVMKADVESICAAIVDVTDLDAEWSKTYKVSPSGQLREV